MERISKVKKNERKSKPMEISSFPKAAAAPHALPNEASAVSSRAAVENFFLTDGVSRTTRWVDTQEQRDGLPLKRGRDWTFPASAKIEDIEYLFLQSTKGGNQQAGLMSSHFRCLFCVSWLTGFSWFPGSLRCVAQNPRIPAT